MEINKLVAQYNKPFRSMAPVKVKTSAKYPVNPAKFHCGNREAAAENMSAASHARRIQGMFKAWETKARIDRGENIMGVREKRVQRRRVRAKLIVTVAKEAREIQHIARTHAQAAMKRLASIITDYESQDTAAIAAISVLLDRAYGKANQTNINANLDANGKPAEVTGKELDTRIEETLRRVEALTGGAPKEAPRKELPPDLRKLN